MRYRVIQEHDRRYPIRPMCRALAVSPAGYYAWRGRPESRRAAANHTLLATIRVLHQESRQTYGSPSIWRALRKQGHRVGEHRVARLMRHDGLRAKTVKKWRGHHPIESPLARGGEHAATPVHSVATQPGLGRRYHLRLDPGGLAVSGRAAGPVLTCRHRLGDGPALDRGFNRAGTSHGARHSTTPRRTPASLRSRESICCRAVPTAAHHARHHGQHEPHRQLLGQRLRGKFLRDVEARARIPSAVRDAERGDTGHLRVYRGVL